MTVWISSSLEMGASQAKFCLSVFVFGSQHFKWDKDHGRSVRESERTGEEPAARIVD
jgi:hypothetical protein